MSELKRLMKLRENITHFTDQAPDKKIVDQILKDAHDLIPVKNNMWNYSIDVWGPEHEKEKKIVAMQTVTGLEKRIFAKGGAEEGNIAMLEDIYTEWKASRESQRSSWFKGKGKYQGFGFNDQVTAPYVLVYYQRPGKPSDHQIEQGYDAKQINYSDVSQHQWLISASMHGYGTTLLCAEQELYASFCKCYYLVHKNLDNILHPLHHGFHNVAFILGIGYRDLGMPYFKNKKKPNMDEIVNWK